MKFGWSTDHEAGFTVVIAMRKWVWPKRGNLEGERWLSPLSKIAPILEHCRDLIMKYRWLAKFEVGLRVC